MPFTDLARTDSAPKRASETEFAFLNRSARPEIAHVRNFVSSALANYPAEERAELIARIQSGDDVAFRSASFELILHAGLTLQGFLLSPHPDPGTGTSKRPDFLVVDPHGEEFILEAVLASERDGRSEAAEAIKRTTLGVLDQAPHEAFYLDVDSEGDPSTQPSGRELARSVHEWLGSLNADALREMLEHDGMDRMPSMTWSHEEWTLTFRAIPASASRRGNLSRLVGAFGDGARWTNAWEPLKNAVKVKANRYGALERPLVVAVNFHGFHLDPIDEEQALFGQEEWVEVVGRPDLSGPRRVQNGAWRGPHGPQNRRASAVWFFNDLTPYTVAVRRSTLYLNPWARLPAPESLRRFPTRHISNDALATAEGISPREMLGLPPGWPE